MYQKQRTVFHVVCFFFFCYSAKLYVLKYKNGRISTIPVEKYSDFYLKYLKCCFLLVKKRVLHIANYCSFIVDLSLKH